MRQSLKSSSKKQVAEQRAGQARAAAASAERWENTIYQDMVDAGVEINHHESDLYVPVNDVTRKLLWHTPVNGATTFTGSDGKSWFELPFQYQPHWKNSGSIGRALQPAQPPTEREQAITRLREWVKPEDRIYTILRHVTRTGRRTVQLIALNHDKESKQPFFCLGYNVACALGLTYDERLEGVRYPRADFRTNLHLIQPLSRLLFGDPNSLSNHPL